MVTPYMFLTPFIVMFGVFLVYPIIYSFIISLSHWQAGHLVFRGLFQYRLLLNDGEFWESLLNVGIILVVQVPIMLTLAAIYASLLNSPRLKGRALFQLGFFLPVLIDMVAYSLVFSFLLAPDGLLNHFIGLFGIPPINWLNSPQWSKIAIMIAMTWHWTGYNIIILLGAMQSIPVSIYEAASLDGAGAVKQWASITLPLVAPILLFESVLSTIGTLQLFTEPYILTAGGPEHSSMTPVLYLYQVAFQQFHFGYASAIAFAVAVLIALLSIVQLRVSRERANI
ncbi:lactose ABC transporter permease [Sulfobacillus thermotolerans]|uniref:Lactose ABC transporter permease n=1 Tax=Sulfobacillus thermotolerans TaxID=338644 RepID=A0ABN5H0P9_9FIRM|nr:lactose ABC transporter permease [Sulfobacillus thermotolerans]